MWDNGGLQPKNDCLTLKDLQHLNSLLVLQNFTTAQKGGNILFTYKKLFSSDTHQSMKASDGDLEVSRNVYPDAVNVIGCV